MMDNNGQRRVVMRMVSLLYFSTRCSHKKSFVIWLRFALELARGRKSERVPATCLKMTFKPEPAPRTSNFNLIEFIGRFCLLRRVIYVFVYQSPFRPDWIGPFWGAHCCCCLGRFFSSISASLSIYWSNNNSIKLFVIANRPPHTSNRKQCHAKPTICVHSGEQCL